MTQVKARRGRPRKPVKYKRRTFMFDTRTDEEVVLIQRALRATTASEAVRYVIRKHVELMTHAGQGGKLRVEFANKKQSLLLDITPLVLEEV